MCIRDSYGGNDTMTRVTITIFGLAFIVLLCGAASAAQINVNQTGWWNATGDTTFHAINPGQIQAAIDNATAGDTIYVYNGSYNENVDVDKQLTLVGEGADVVTVTAASSNDHVFRVTINYVNISGFTATGATGTNCRGIYLYYVQHCKISENNASGNYYGIDLYSSSDNTLTSNTANSNEYGIDLYSSSDNTLTSNIANSNNYGIHLWYSSDHNTLTSNTANSNSDNGIWLDSSSDNTLTSNTANSNNYGIYLSSSSNCDTQHNTLTNNIANSNNYGIYLDSCYPSNSKTQHNTLANNTANSNNYGICLRYSSDHNTLTNNIANSNNYGIRLDTFAINTPSDNTLTNNIANSNSDDGIYLESSNNNTLTENTANSNKHGIDLCYSSNNNISCNWVHNNTDLGFYLRSGSTGNTIANNSIIANGVVQGDGSYHWQFENRQSSDVNTANNWWGTNNETRIDASIYDQTHYASYGEVITSPRLDGLAPCAPVPELPTIALLAVGLLMLAGYVRIERKKDG